MRKKRKEGNQHMYKMHTYSEDKMLYLTSTKCLPSVLSFLPVSLVVMVWQYMYMRAPTLQCKHSNSSFPRREWAWVDRARGRGDGEGEGRSRKEEGGGRSRHGLILG